MVDQLQAPNRGDVIWVSLNPQAGHEQAGRRPALVLSPVEYNSRVGLALMCPVTSRAKGYPFEVALPSNLDNSTRGRNQTEKGQCPHNMCDEP